MHAGCGRSVGMVHNGSRSSAVDSSSDFVGIVKAANHNLTQTAAASLTRDDGLLGRADRSLQHDGLSTNIKTSGAQFAKGIAAASFGDPALEDGAIIVQD